jgi:hypothetical protein
MTGMRIPTSSIRSSRNPNTPVALQSQGEKRPELQKIEAKEGNKRILLL